MPTDYTAPLYRSANRALYEKKNIRSQIAVALIGCLLLFFLLTETDDPELLIALGFLPLGLVFFYRNTFSLCLMFIIFSFFRIHEAYRFLEPLRIPSLLAMSTLLFLGWKIALERSIQPYWRKELTPFFIFFGIVTFGCFLAQNREIAWNYWNATYSKIAIMVVAIAWLCRTPKDFAISSRMFVVAGIAVGYVAITNKLNGIGLVEGTRVTIARDIKSVLGDPNDLSLVLLFPFSFALSMVYLRTSKFGVWLGTFGAGVMFWAIICTQSRGGLLGILAVTGTIGSRVIKSKVVLAGIGLVAAFVLLAVAGISKRSSGGAHESGIDESAQGRLYAWEAAWNMALAKPLNGMGLDNFIVNYFYYSPHWDGLNHAVHSTWFGVLGETGFPGLFVFLFMVFVIFRSVYLSDKKLIALNAPKDVQSTALALLAGLVAFCASASFLTQGFTWPLYIILALTTAVGKFADDFEKNHKIP